MSDINVLAFAQLLWELPREAPITEAMEAASGEKGWWDSQQDHMTSWFTAQSTHGSGSYTRQTPNLSARKTYNRLQSPEGLMWIAEALGVDKDLLKRVADEALTVPRRSQSKFVRQHIPWEMIVELALKEIAQRELVEPVEPVEPEKVADPLPPIRSGWWLHLKRGGRRRGR
ncbi:hypothetical protein GC425_02900 [Corynebacterium sp. zg254]|uniref:DUF222 domain-containing protein n=1 Tax=Corynebacterium zhongnanshanii TaxID=2768834 RepID=A0ABQ6VFA4_9CORY|nr:MULTISPECIES: hypothetical protein [Corynebacterium]KAB3523087.1 hypothetical protein F8377_02720 [Corynebacterium zhongnanshanii]MCR5913817.1 hypothetical protein [Corynebacterium sp. zg254]